MGGMGGHAQVERSRQMRVGGMPRVGGMAGGVPEGDGEVPKSISTHHTHVIPYILDETVLVWVKVNIYSPYPRVSLDSRQQPTYVFVWRLLLGGWWCCRRRRRRSWRTGRWCRRPRRVTAVTVRMVFSVYVRDYF